MTNSLNPSPGWTPERIGQTVRDTVIVIAVGILIGVFITSVNRYYIGAVIVGIILTGLVSRRFEAVLLVYAAIAFVPWGGTPDLAVGGSGEGKGVYISELMLAFLLAVWFSRYLLGGLPKHRIRSGFYAPIALYMAYCLLNVVNSFVFWDPHVDRIYQRPVVNVIELALRLLSIGALIMMATTVTTRKWLTWATFALMVPGVYNALAFLTGCRLPVTVVWWSLLTLLPAGYFWAITLSSVHARAQRIAAATAVILVLFTVLVLNISWVSGWLGLLMSLATVTLVRSRRAFVAMLAVACVLAAVAWPFLHQNVISASEKEGDYDRFSLMAGAVKYATVFPLGVGLGNYRTYNTYHYGAEWGTKTYSSAHGTYSQHLAEMGFPGLALFLAIQVCGFVWIFRSYKAMRSGPSRIFLLAVMGQMVGMAASAAFGDYIIPVYHNGGITTFSATVYSWLIWGLAIAHVRIYGEETDGSLSVDR